MRGAEQGEENLPEGEGDGAELTGAQEVRERRKLGLFIGNR